MLELSTTKVVSHIFNLSVSEDFIHLFIALPSSPSEYPLSQIHGLIFHYYCYMYLHRYIHICTHAYTSGVI